MDQIGSLRYQPQIPSRRAISPSPFPAFSISVLPRYPAPAPCGNNRSGNPAEQKRWRERGTERAPQKTETSLAPGIGKVVCHVTSEWHMEEEGKSVVLCLRSCTCNLMETKMPVRCHSSGTRWSSRPL